MQILFAGFVASFLLMSSEIISYSQQSDDALFYADQVPAIGEIISNPLKTIQLAAAPNATGLEFSSQLINQDSVNASIQTGFSLLLHIFAGLIICRMACSEFAKGSGICLEKSSTFAIKKLPTVLLGILFPLIVIAILCGLTSFLLAIEYIPIVGPWIAGISYSFSIPFLFLSVVLGLGLIIGWPLMIAAIACESSDSFDAWSRSFDYLRSRLIPILIAFAVTMTAGVFLMGCATELSLLTFSWLDTFQSNILGQPLETIQSRSDATFGQGAAGFQQLWKTLWSNLLVGYLITFYWCTVSAIYIIVRHSVDRVSLNEFQQR